MVTMPSLAVIDPPPLRGKLMGAIGARFTIIGWLSAGVLAVTGVIRLLNNVASPAVLFGTTYGNMLLVKMVLFVAIVAVVAVISFVLSPKVAAMAPPPPGAAGGHPPAGGPPPAQLPQFNRE